jgi:hypothetical protein
VWWRGAELAAALTPLALADIDWQMPWLADWRSLGSPTAQRVGAGVPQPEALNQLALMQWPEAAQVPIRFVPQASLPAGMAYEVFIFEQRQCPTREGLHDFFNGLVWLNFPLTKRRLNQLHMAQIAMTGIAPVRGPARDALTVMDENGALLRAPDALWDALVAKDWLRLFGELRPLWQQARLLLFGHALLEKLVYPRKSITAHVWRVFHDTDSIADMDAWLAADLCAERLASKPFAHLPVLGVPHWWAANENPAFYNDVNVFRPPRTQSVSSGNSA